MFIQVTMSLLEGFKTTFQIFFMTLLFALPLGLIISFGSMCRVKAVKWFVKTFIWIIRGTPLMLQLIVFYYGPGLVGTWAQKMISTGAMSGPLIDWLATWHTFERFFALILAFVINYACYFSEIYRGGIESIPHGQYEAGQVLGMTKTQIFFKVILMQVVKRILPPMSNEVITLVKDTALARVIMIVELIQAAQNFAGYGLMWPLFYTAVFYLAFVGILTLLFGFFERKLNYYKV